MFTYLKIIDDFFQRPFLAIGSSILIAILCFIPNTQVPDITDDKTAHFIAFAGLGVLWFLCTKNKILALIGLLFFGVFIEIGQYLLPESFHRSFDVYDIIADYIGVFIGYILYRFYLIVSKIYLKS